MLFINAFKHKETLDSDTCGVSYFKICIVKDINSVYFFLLCFSDIDCRLNIYVCLC